MILDERVMRFRASFAPTPEPHTHLAKMDEKGNGATTFDAGHSHEIKDGEVQPGKDGHKHALTPEETQRGVRDPFFGSIFRHQKRRHGSFPGAHKIIFKLREALRAWPD